MCLCVTNADRGRENRTRRRKKRNITKVQCSRKKRITRVLPFIQYNCESETAIKNVYMAGQCIYT